MTVSIISRGTTNVRLKAALGIPGPQGEKGWAPILATVTDGARRVLRVTDWTGGEGTKPATGSYVGATGLVSDIADAVDIRGAQGQKGWSPVFAVVSDSARRVLQVVDWTGGEGSEPATGSYVGATGLVADIAAAVDIRGPQGEQGPPISSEVIDDRVAQLLTAGANVTLTYNDAGNSLQVSVPAENIQDVVGSFISAGPNIAVSYNDAGNLFAISVPDENIQDVMAGTLTAGTGIGISYDDAANTITISNTLLDAVLVSSGTIPGGVSTADISLPSGSRAYHLKVWGLATGMQTNIVLRLSHDNGATYDATDYVYTGADYGLAGHIPFNSASGTSLPIINNAVDVISGRLVDIRISTARPGGASYRGLVAFSCTGSEPANPVFHRFLWGVGPSKSNPVTNIRFVFGTPAAAGAKWALYKLQEGA